MFNLIAIVKQNRATFYNYSDGKRTPILLFNIYKLIIATLLATLFCNIGKDFPNAIITVYSILIGFSFNILFYLLSINKMKVFSEKDSLEKQIKIKKINKLTDELFYNVSYFNITSILLVVIVLIFFLFDSRLSQFIAQVEDVAFVKPLVAKIGPNLIYVRNLVSFSYRLFLYFLIIETLYSLVRTIGRVTFYFQEKIKLQNDA